MTEKADMVKDDASNNQAEALRREAEALCLITQRSLDAVQALLDEPDVDDAATAVLLMKTLKAAKAAEAALEAASNNSPDAAALTVEARACVLDAAQRTGALSLVEMRPADAPEGGDLLRGDEAQADAPQVVAPQAATAPQVAAPSAEPQVAAASPAQTAPMRPVAAPVEPSASAAAPVEVAVPAPVVPTPEPQLAPVVPTPEPQLAPVVPTPEVPAPAAPAAGAQVPVPAAEAAPAAGAQVPVPAAEAAPAADVNPPKERKPGKRAFFALLAVLLVLAGLCLAVWMGWLKLPFLDDKLNLLPDPNARSGSLNITDGSVAPGSFRLVLNQKPTMQAGSTACNIEFEVPSGSQYSARLELVASDGGEKLAETRMVLPGNNVETVQLAHALDTGEHKAKVQVYVYTGTTLVNTVDAEVTIRVS